MKKAIITILIIITFLVGYFSSKIAHRYPDPFKPSTILHFKPVRKGSDPDQVRIAQAELCRHGIPVKIDGECGKDTALGMCELLVKIQDGYKVYSIYERNPNAIP